MLRIEYCKQYVILDHLYLYRARGSALGFDVDSQI